ncbi:MAG: CDP-alcohol phosphatidyltransferase family protein [Saprospiraceae bacterium]|nr:CDP-alcohol phosphatidyltransferase family protein [Saprospiraceae bacterium]
MIGELDIKQANQRIRKSRERKHILKELEFSTIEYLCPRIPKWITPDKLTIIGLIGSLMVAVSMILSVSNPYFLGLAVVGFSIQWFGDSLDGRIAYYRNIPRKWYGWALDINADWISISLIGLGFYFYLPSYKFLAFIFVLAYGGSMIITLLRYKVSNEYIIDTGILGPTEMRILICIVLVAEFFIPNSLLTFISIGSIILITMNIYESVNIIREGDMRDIKEKRAKKMGIVL